MELIFKKPLYKSRNKNKWTQTFFCLVLFEPRNYQFFIQVVRIIIYKFQNKIKVRKSYSYQSLANNYQDLKPSLIKNLLDKYGYKIRYFKLFNQMINTIERHYQSKIQILIKLLKPLPDAIIINYIARYLI